MIRPGAYVIVRVPTFPVRWGKVVSITSSPIIYVTLWSPRLNRYVKGTEGYHEKFVEFAAPSDVPRMCPTCGQAVAA